MRVAIAHSVSCGWTTTVGAGPLGGLSARDAVVKSTALARDASATKNSNTTARPRRVNRSDGRCAVVATMRFFPSRTGVRSNARTTVYQNRRTEVEPFRATRRQKVVQMFEYVVPRRYGSRSRGVSRAQVHPHDAVPGSASAPRADEALADREGRRVD